jgi:hypothetical protein
VSVATPSPTAPSSPGTSGSLEGCVVSVSPNDGAYNAQPLRQDDDGLEAMWGRSPNPTFHGAETNASVREAGDGAAFDAGVFVAC